MKDRYLIATPLLCFVYGYLWGCGTADKKETLVETPIEQNPQEQVIIDSRPMPEQEYVPPLLDSETLLALKHNKYADWILYHVLLLDDPSFHIREYATEVLKNEPWDRVECLLPSQATPERRLRLEALRKHHLKIDSVQEHWFFDIPPLIQ